MTLLMNLQGGKIRMVNIQCKEKKTGFGVALFSLFEPVTPLTFTNVVKRFFLPFSKRPLCWLVWLVVLTVTTVLYVQNGLSELHRQNLMDARVLAAELKHEAGDNWLESAREHEVMFRTTANIVNARHLALAARLFYPSYDFGELFASVIKDMNNLSTDEEARQKIPILAERMIAFCDKVDKHFNASIIWYKTDNVDPEVIRATKVALNDSNDLLIAFEKSSTELMNSGRLADESVRRQIMEDARKLCMKHRYAWQSLFVSRLGYNDKQSMRAFGQTALRAHFQMKTLADEIRKVTEDELDRDASFLDRYAASEKRRQNVVLVMIDGDEKKLCKAVQATLTNESGNS